MHSLDSPTSALEGAAARNANAGAESQTERGEKIGKAKGEEYAGGLRCECSVCLGRVIQRSFYSGKINIEVIQNSILNNIMVLAFLLECFHGIVCMDLTVPAVRLSLVFYMSWG